MKNEMAVVVWEGAWEGAWEEGRARRIDSLCFMFLIILLDFKKLEENSRIVWKYHLKMKKVVTHFSECHALLLSLSLSLSIFLTLSLSHSLSFSLSLSLSLSHSLSFSGSSKSSFSLEIFSVLYSCMGQSWSEGVFLSPLTHRFWKLTLQVGWSFVATPSCLTTPPIIANGACKGLATGNIRQPQRS